MTPKKDDSPEVYKQEQFCFNNSGITQRRTGIHLYDRHLHNDFIKKTSYHQELYIQQIKRRMHQDSIYQVL